ncbi:MAG: hypothetical protein AAF717_04230 [Bacteroidota bacterium]
MFVTKLFEIQKMIDFLIYDKQGPLSNAIKHVFKKVPVHIHRYKKLSDIRKALESKTGIKFLFLMFVFNEDSEFMDYLHLEKLGIPIVFAPTNKLTYTKLAGIEGIKVMDVSKSKQEYMEQIKFFFDIAQF